VRRTCFSWGNRTAPGRWPGRFRPLAPARGRPWAGGGGFHGHPQLRSDPAFRILICGDDGGAYDASVTEVSPLRAEDYESWFAAAEAAFGSPVDPAERDRDRELIEPDRALVARLDGADRAGAPWDGIVGTAAVLPLRMAVPGGVLPVAGVSVVSVAPTHRRQGLLSTLMRRQLADVRDRAEPLAALFASEHAIYGRFGYGMASRDVALRAGRGHRLLADLPRQPVRLGNPEDLRAETAAVYERAWPERPGHFARDERWWRAREATDTQSAGRRAPLLAAVTEGGYALYETEPGWGPGAVPAARLYVREVVAVTPAALATIWRYLLELDLIGEIHGPRLAEDDAVLSLLADPRRAEPRLRDNLWVRLVDVPAALEGRRYWAGVDVVFGVRDRWCPWNEGSFRLVAGAEGRAECRRTDAAADLELDVAALGAAYLGGTSLQSQADAGLVTERRAGAVAAASVALRGIRQPLCPQLF
jgi:predicted acetyltransferase